MGRSVAVLQSNYIPWKGYFDIVHDADLFVFYDDVQFTKNDWRNRNLIKTPAGREWLSIPVGSRIDRLICDVEIKNHEWQKTHWGRLQQNYRHSRYFASFHNFLEELYGGRVWENLASLNHFVIQKIARDFLGLCTEFTDSREYQLQGRRQDRLMCLLRQTGATKYISGPAARAYLDPARFEDAGIQLVWKTYDSFPEYPQFYPPFAHQVSILDLLFHTGPNAADFIWKR